MAWIGRWTRFFATMVVCCGFSGCGLSVPDIKEIWDTDLPADPSIPRAKLPGAAQIEWEIKKRIYCDLRRAVNDVSEIPVNEGPYGVVVKKQRGLIPRDWQAQVSLTLQVDEASSLTPGVTLNRVLPNKTTIFGPGSAGTVTTQQAASLGFGGTLSSTATRIDKFDPYYSVESLLQSWNDPHSVCIDGNDPLDLPGFKPDSSSPFILESDLGIEDWLQGAMIVDNWLPSTGSPPQALGGGGGGKGAAAPGAGAGGGAKGPAVAAAGGGKSKIGGNKDITKDTITYEVKFVIVSTGTVTPTWKLVRVSANTSGTLFSANRTRTHDLIITLGPPTAAAAQTHFASQLGNAVSNGNRSVTTSTSGM